MGECHVIDTGDRTYQSVACILLCRLSRLQLQRHGDEAEIVLDAMVHFPNQKLFLVHGCFGRLQRALELNRPSYGIAEASQKMNVIF
jgi:hypothetical protein